MCDKERLYDLIKEAFLLLDDGDRRFFQKFDLTVRRYYALHHIAELPGISFSQLSDCLVCDKSNVTRIIKGLEKSGYVTRQPHETDGRTFRLYLTEEGTAVFTVAAAAHKKYNEARLDCIDQFENESMIDGLTKLNEFMRKELYAPVVLHTP